MRRGEFIVPPPPSPTNSLPPPIVPIPVLSTLDSSATPGPAGSYAPDAPIINIYKGRTRQSILPAWISKWFR
ncbi:hypothetical protein PYCCODRAFT_1437527 [Trametes coccinea BRFM310]|uniref:Uncharacterized protein n=1 Tax=Trametes coccinea (strain BRFM310) TaxID=1353009 RepID=A0A1Y2IKF8_TRAC3|nr:hypothetical protein PYCCODRAFT_1437527 [Trametes coccinea BRFM310]